MRLQLSDALMAGFAATTLACSWEMGFPDCQYASGYGHDGMKHGGATFDTDNGVTRFVHAMWGHPYHPEQALADKFLF